jgi:hypothetical protein
MDSPAAVRRQEVVDLILFRDGWERQHIPRLMLLNVSNQIVGMQALHDDDNRPLFLAVEAAAQGVVKPLIHGPAAGFRQSVVRL